MVLWVLDAHVPRLQGFHRHDGGVFQRGVCITPCRCPGSHCGGGFNALEAQEIDKFDGIFMIGLPASRPYAGGGLGWITAPESRP